jgi:hypothetical protein
MTVRPTHLTGENLKLLLRNRDRGKGSVVGTRHKVRQQLDPLKRASHAKSHIRPTSGIASRLGIKTLGVTAGSNPAPSPQYRSKWEASYAATLELEKRAHIIRNYWFEPFSLWLPGKIRYKPAFLVQHYPLHEKVDPLELIEVKGWSKNRRDGRTRLKIAAAIYNCFVWRLVYRTKGGGWDGEYL